MKEAIPSNPARREKRHAPVKLGNIFTSVIEQLNSPPALDPRAPQAIRTGLMELDMLLGGLERGRVHLICGPDGVGKTAFAIQVAAHVAQEQNTPVLFVTDHNGSEEMARRFLAHRAGVDLNRLRPEHITTKDRDQLIAVIPTACHLPLYVFADRDRTAKQVVHVARSAHDEHQVGLIVIDNVPSRPRDVATDFFKALRRIAKKLDVPVLATCASRNSDDGIPLGPRCRDAECEAGVCIALRRDGMYERDGKIIQRADFHVLRHVDGPTGIVTTRFIHTTGTFRDLGENS